MKVVIRADGGGDIGWGHLSRCTALAEVLIEAGVDVRWACREDAAVERITGAPPALTLPDLPTMGALSTTEAATLCTFASDADWILVDHYGADEAYLAVLAADANARVMVFDDHQVRRGATLRLAPNQGEAPDTLAGPAYQPIRPCFTRTPRSSQRGGWLLALGGADPRDDTAKCLSHLGGGPPLTVLASDAIAARQGLDGILPPHARRLAWVPPHSLAATLAASEAALVSASTLSWEALATGTPIVALQTADNQVGVVETLRAAGVPVFTDALDAARALRDGLARRADPDARLDGLGAWRVARAMGVDTEGSEG